MKWNSFVLVFVMLVGATSTGWSHHSFVGTYEPSKKVQIEGTVAQFLFRNPHSLVHVMAPDENGVMQRWTVEWRGAGGLGGQGITRDTFKYGDVVTISGNPGRNPSEHRIRMVTIHRKSDGFGWGEKPGEVVD